MDPTTKPADDRPEDPPPYSPSWTYPSVQNAPGGYPPQPGGYPPAQPQDPARPGPPMAQAGAYYAYPPPAAQPAHPSSVTVTTTSTTVPQSATHIVMVDACPSCHAGMLHDQFTPCGVLLAIFFFPIGVFCCIAMRQRVCSNCHATFSA